MNAGPTDIDDFNPHQITRPDEALLRYYLLVAALTLVGFPFVFALLYFKYRTLRYTFDDKGISMSWGILFKREIYLTYRRIQDIHVSRNLFHRWLGLAEVAIQTASGSAGAEMTIEGICEPQLLRDYLYRRMRGVEDVGAAAISTTPAKTGSSGNDVTILLSEIRDEVRTLRQKLETRP